MYDIQGKELSHGSTLEGLGGVAGGDYLIESTMKHDMVPTPRPEAKADRSITSLSIHHGGAARPSEISDELRRSTCNECVSE